MNSDSRRRGALRAITLSAALVIAAGLSGCRLLNREASGTGGETFERVLVTDQANWRFTGEFDGEPGDEIALVTYDAVQLVTPATLAPATRLDLASDPNHPWNANTRLARMNGRLVIVETGGGFSDTLVRSPAGDVLWRYHPDADVPPTAMLPADLDNDGSAEFYASIANSVVRLDAAGQEAWRRPYSSGTLVASAARSRSEPGWIVGLTASVATVWSEDGARLAALPLRSPAVLGAFAWPDTRHLVEGGRSLRAVGLDGTTAFEWTVEGMSVVDALPVRLEPAGPLYLALVAAGPTGASQWRVQLVSKERALVFDEVLTAPPRLLKARGADGVDTLLVSTDSLNVLRPRRR